MEPLHIRAGETPRSMYSPNPVTVQRGTPSAWAVKGLDQVLLSAEAGPGSAPLSFWGQKGRVSRRGRERQEALRGNCEIC